MNRKKEDKSKGKNFRWSKLMSQMLLQILAEEVLKGNKPSSTFKHESLERVAEEISERFNTECIPEYVTNHLKTVKSTWKMITTLKDKSCFGWNENLKMITAEKRVYTDEVMANPSHEKFLNKPIEMYDEMKLVAGKDIATTTFDKSFYDRNLDETTVVESTPLDDNDMLCEEITMTKETTSSCIPSSKRSHRKRGRVVEDPNATNVAKIMDVMAAAIQSSEKDQTKMVSKLCEEDRGKGKQFRWSKLMSQMLLEILAEEALKGNKPSSTFKQESLLRVAEEISERFNIECHPVNVKSHLKNIKSTWKMISTLKERSCFGWNENLKMITADKSVYTKEVIANPSHEKFLNKSIEMYDQMKLVAVNDNVTRTFDKPFDDRNLDETALVKSTPLDDNDVVCEEITMTNETTSSCIPSSKRSHRKRGCMFEDPNANHVAKRMDVMAADSDKDPTKMVSKLYEEDRGKGKQFRWSKLMSQMLLKILAEEALKGNKPPATFKQESIERVAEEISERFSIECLPDHVSNHLKTVKSTWKMISTLKEKSCFGWNENLKMITADKSVYTEEVLANPSHEKFLNKPIEMYDEMKLVAGKDNATRTFAKSRNERNLDQTTEVESTSLDDNDDDVLREEITKAKETSSSYIPSSKRSHRKRGPAIHDLAKKMDVIAAAIQSLNKDPTQWVSKLYEEVMKTEGFDEITLAGVFDYLVVNEMLAKAFMVKNANLRKFWVQNFLNQPRGPVT